MSHESKRGAYSRIEYLKYRENYIFFNLDRETHLILLPNRLTGVMRLGNWNVFDCPFWGPSCSTAFTVLVTVPNSLGLVLSEMFKLSRLSCDDTRESGEYSDPLEGSWNRRTLDNDSAK